MYKTTRILLQCIAVGIFIVQMKQAVDKYYNNPNIKMVSEVGLGDIKMPELYICPMDQFNYSQGSKQGYAWNVNFLAGRINCSSCTEDLSWKGADQLTYDEIMDELYDHNHDITIFPENTEVEDMFILPEGFCKKVLTLGESIIILSKGKITAHLVDPYKANIVRKETDGISGDTMSIKPLKTDYEINSFKIQLMKIDKRIMNGKTCTDYSELGTTRAECFENTLKKTFLNHLKCIPPWFPAEKNLICKDDITSTEDTKTLVYNMCNQLLAKLDVEVADQCLPDCTQIEAKVENNFYRSNYKSGGILDITFMKKVPVYTFIDSYGFFDLVVEAGSALGLWLGLSAIGIFDAMALILLWSVKTYKQRFH